MKKTTGFAAGLIIALCAGGWFAYADYTDDTYQGMSIIPEKREDLPLYEGLEATGHEYKMEGSHQEKIYQFYLEELPEYGWKLVYKQYRTGEDGGSQDFTQLWQKAELDEELALYGGYTATLNQTEVIFDKYEIRTSTTWISEQPENVYIYPDGTDGEQLEIKDQEKVAELVALLNGALDTEGGIPPREKKSVIRIGNLMINVYYEKDKAIYFDSEKGIKSMKPEPEFFELTNLSI